jgi:NDP-sugar pyrophosphorylase family protein
MKAMILAAGLGTRLKPLTDTIPKAMVPLAGKPLIYHTINKLKSSGVTQIIINIHHFAGSIIKYVESNNGFGVQIAFSREEALLDTGGGLKNASWFFNDDRPFILHNVDVLSGIDLSTMINYHNEKKSLATLAIRKRNTSRYFLFNQEKRLVGWQSLESGEKEIISPLSVEPEKMSFMGIHIISPEIFSFLPEKKIFSIVKAYLQMAKNGHHIYGYRNDDDYWIDLGQKEQLEQAEKYLSGKRQEVNVK